MPKLDEGEKEANIRKPFRTGNLRQDELNDFIVEEFHKSHPSTRFDIGEMINRLTTNVYSADEIRQSMEYLAEDGVLNKEPGWLLEPPMYMINKEY